MYGFITNGGETYPAVLADDRVFSLQLVPGDHVVVGGEFVTAEGRSLRCSEGTRLGDDGYCWNYDEGFYAFVKTNKEFEEKKLRIRRDMELLEEQYGF